MWAAFFCGFFNCVGAQCPGVRCGRLAKMVMRRAVSLSGVRATNPGVVPVELGARGGSAHS